jgi:hypothetical protein
LCHILCHVRARVRVKQVEYPKGDDHHDYDLIVNLVGEHMFVQTSHESTIAALEIKDGRFVLAQTWDGGPVPAISLTAPDAVEQCVAAIMDLVELMASGSRKRRDEDDGFFADRY